MNSHYKAVNNVTAEAVIECRDVSKSYVQGETTVSVLNKINLSLLHGESMAIIGVSGSGKSSLLNLLGGLDRPSSGEIFVKGQSLQGLDDKAMARLRNREIGFVYQLHHLLMEFTALENVMMPLLIAGLSRQQAAVRSEAILAQVGLSHRLQHRPSALSGGERQRVAIARALVNNPACVLMDEPTGNLDVHTASRILDLIAGLQQQLKISFVVVTHDVALAKRIGHVMRLQDGQLQSAGA